MFTFDADMEWDFGTPWYRRLRIVTSSVGSISEWAERQGKWPRRSYEERLPPVVDIGPGTDRNHLGEGNWVSRSRYRKHGGVLHSYCSEIDSRSLASTGELFAGRSRDVFVYGTYRDRCGRRDGALYFASGDVVQTSAVVRVAYLGDESQDGPRRQRTRNMLAARACSVHTAGEASIGVTDSLAACEMASALSLRYRGPFPASCRG